MSTATPPGPRAATTPPNTTDMSATTGAGKAPALDSTPLARKISGSGVFSSVTVERNDANMRLAEETKGRWIGPVPAQKFLDEYLPVASNPGKVFDFAKVAGAKGEDLKYGLLAEEVNKAELACLRLVDTHDARSHGLGPDVTGYRFEDLDSVKRVEQGKETKYGIDFAKMVLWVELKTADVHDPLDDMLGVKVTKDQGSTSSAGPSKDAPTPTPSGIMSSTTPMNTTPFEKQVKDLKLIRGQLASYAEAQAGNQFLKHFFSVVLFGQYARLIRWDRSCAVVSERFKYGVPENDFLGSFFHRFSLLTPEQRGEDPTIATCERRDVPLAVRTRLIEANQKCHKEFRKMVIPDLQHPQQFHSHIISYPPDYGHRSPFGRATRSMQAYDEEAGRFVFVKDYWRPTGPHVVTEGAIYAKLKHAKVRHMVPFGHGNDLPSHSTLDLTGKAWASRPPGVLQNYRMSLKVVGHPLRQFRNTRHLVKVVADAMEGHDDAYFKAHILHRDISVGNIIIAPEHEEGEEDPEVKAIEPGSGLLIDWDLCIPVPNNLPARQIERTGTWQFISGHLLENPSARQGIADDRESAFHVICWVALKYSKNSAGVDLARFLDNYDEGQVNDLGVPFGGRGKREILASNKGFSAEFNKPLDSTLAELIDVLGVRYRKVPSQAQIGKYLAMERQLAGNPIFDDLAQELVAHIYITTSKKLEEEGWLVKCLRDKLDPEANWPEDDVQNNNAKASGSSKRSYVGTGTRLFTGPSSQASNKRFKSGSSGPTFFRPDELEILGGLHRVGEDPGEEEEGGEEEGDEEEGDEEEEEEEGDEGEDDVDLGTDFSLGR